MKKILFVFIFTTIFVAFAFSAHSFTKAEQEAVDKMMLFRLETALLTSEETITAVDKYTKEFLAEAAEKYYSEEAILTIENYLVIEKFSSFDEINPNHPEMEPLLKAQNEKNDKWFKAHEKEEKTSWFYCSYAGIISNYLRYQSLFAKMEKGLLVKDYLDIALKQDPKMSVAQVGIAMWLFYAPAISGGSVNKALDYFEQAVVNARNNSELFYAVFYKTQCLFHKGKKNEYKTAMDELKKIIPANRKVELLEKLNAAGYTIFDYQDNRAKIQKKLGI